MDIVDLLDLLYYLKWIFLSFQLLILAITFILVNLDSVRSEFGTKKILLVTAHPDDESMFFIPFIVNFRRTNDIYLLCLSNGDADDLGSTREVELAKACTFLGVKGHTIIDNESLKDGMNNRWNTQLIEQIVLKEIRERDANIIVSFDIKGISSHPNHCAISQAMQKIANKEESIDKELKFFELETTGIIRKYIGVLDAILSFRNDYVFLNVNLFTTWKAMATHHSQFVWFRKLFVLFSRYGYINTLAKIN
ncbi:unnamed protein product [Blepharisma stoltei]|uniref:N-acetylglucosaminylphosphatidylinositol deacetylase n=1 Tax=Blepharisma stoltei TaxID=1481888 RepID=A0AAU9K8M1_9CILI|nr:unnamed protein product [Blepharisma stoltei]